MCLAVSKQALFPHRPRHVDEPLFPCAFITHGLQLFACCAGDVAALFLVFTLAFHLCQPLFDALPIELYGLPVRFPGIPEFLSSRPKPDQGFRVKVRLETAAFHFFVDLSLALKQIGQFVIKKDNVALAQGIFRRYLPMRARQLEDTWELPVFGQQVLVM